MKKDNEARLRANRVWLGPESCDLEDFAALVSRTTKHADYPFASDIAANIPIYDGEAVRAAASDPQRRQEIMAEWVEVMLTGPGVVVFRNAFPNHAPIDAASKIFFDIIAEQHRTNSGGGDHFAKPGANDRIWNALEKLCLRAPDVFARYYANDIIALISEAWLGTSYQVTSQLNVVNPGGEAQSAHRDYHMGFQSAAEIARFPAHAHRLSPMLTLQGAVAHCDMPLESGPTLYLPFSQTCEAGYFVYSKPEFRAYFDKHRVQLPLAKGDAAFFNPAVFHGAGTNHTNHIKRMANLLQVSSAYGRAMENMDRARMALSLYGALQAMPELSAQGRANAVSACAEGYAFPTNLDRDPPLGGLAPQSQAALMREALDNGWTAAAFGVALQKRRWSQLT